MQPKYQIVASWSRGRSATAKPRPSFVKDGKVKLETLDLIHQQHEFRVTEMVSFEGRVLAIPAVLSLICFLSYSSQYLFTNLAPRPLTTKQSIYFNISLIALLISYARAILTDPGRVPNTLVDASKDQNLLGQGESNVLARERWCRVCQQHKPPRSHHCRVCKRYCS